MLRNKNGHASLARGVAIQFLPGVVYSDEMEASLEPVYPSALGWCHWPSLFAKVAILQITVEPAGLSLRGLVRRGMKSRDYGP